jgi:glycosidase
MYLLVVDRFDNDDPDVPPFDPDEAEYGRDPEQGEMVQGGRISGITRRLDYIQGLGVQAIWLTPVLKNRQIEPKSYHGYAPQNFLDVDPRFGTMEDLQQLVDEAHSRDIAIILDIVLNHTGDCWAYEGEGGAAYSDERLEFDEWREAREDQDEMDGRVWPEQFQNPDWYRRHGEIEEYSDPEQLIRGDIGRLKTLDTSNDEVLGALTECYKFWITATDCDGFRVDSVRNLEPEAVAIVCNALREHALSLGKHNFLIFGEVIGDDDIIADYIEANPDVQGDQDRLEALDGALDYPLYFLLEDVIKGNQSPAAMAQKLDGRLEQGPAEAVTTHWVTFLDNHDQPGRNARGAAYLLTTLGVPCLYYGTEQGFDGGGDDTRYVRECMFGGEWGAFDSKGMHFFNPDHPLYQTIAKVAWIRAHEPALRYGRQYFRDISEDGDEFGPPGEQGTLAYSRILDDDEVIVALNLQADRREDAVEVDPSRTPPGGRVADLMNDREFGVEENEDGIAFVRAPLEGHAIAVLKAMPE